MKIIGLCGGSGSGKGCVCKILSQIGFKTIDTDRVYHDLISEDSECTFELASAFGEQIRSYPGINRARLREVVFSSRDNLDRLNKITHKHILNVVRKVINSVSSDPSILGVVIDAPLLFESGFDKECDVTIAVLADKDVRIERIIERDGISREAAALRINSQISDRDLIGKCTYHVYNNSDLDALESTVRELCENIIDK